MLGPGSSHCVPAESWAGVPHQPRVAVHLHRGLDRQNFPWSWVQWSAPWQVRVLNLWFEMLKSVQAPTKNRLIFQNRKFLLIHSRSLFRYVQHSLCSSISPRPWIYLRKLINLPVVSHTSLFTRPCLFFLKTQWSTATIPGLEWLNK